MCIRNIAILFVSILLYRLFNTIQTTDSQFPYFQTFYFFSTLSDPKTRNIADCSQVYMFVSYGSNFPSPSNQQAEGYVTPNFLCYPSKNIRWNSQHKFDTKISALNITHFLFHHSMTLTKIQNSNKTRKKSSYLKLLFHFQLFNLIYRRRQWLRLGHGCHTCPPIHIIRPPH